MKSDLHLFALWSAAILIAAVAAILYQHGSHSTAIISLLAPSPGVTPDPAATASANPDVYGAASRASGVWSPIGPLSVQTGKIATPLFDLPSTNGSAF